MSNLAMDDDIRYTGQLIAPQKTILVVDDEAEIRELIQDCLADAGYAVQGAANGRAALDLIAASPPDLILLDLMMPGTTGWDVVGELRAQALTRTIPVILISAVRDLAGTAEKLQVAGYLTKPFPLHRMVGLVEVFLHKP